MTLRCTFRRGRLVRLLAIGLVATVTGAAANAQNLDEGKPAQKLFADSCASCHKSPRGLAKGRFSFTLYMFLKEHYSAGPDTAKALTAYLESVDAAAASRATARSPHRAGASARAPRPPAPVAGR